MEPVFSPLDEELALLPGSLAPRQQEHLTHLASWMPFDKAAQMIEEILSVPTNEETVRQLSERMGAYMEAAQAEEDDAASSQESNEQPAPQRCAFSADGAMISLVNKQWAETRTVAIRSLLYTYRYSLEQEVSPGEANTRNERPCVLTWKRGRTARAGLTCGAVTLKIPAIPGFPCLLALSQGSLG